MSTDYSPEEALRDAAATRERTAARVPSVWWHWPLEGIGFGLAVAGIGRAVPSPWSSLLSLLGLAVILSASALYRRRHGIWPSFRAGSTKLRIAWITYTCATAFMLIAALVLREVGASPMWIWALAGWTALVLGLVGFAFDAQARQDIRREPR